MTRIERWLLTTLSLIMILSLAALLRIFYVQNTQIVPVAGGTYIEGSVGDVKPLNPWFAVGNDVTRDIVSLVFSGLLKYDPQTGKIVDDLATVKASEDNRIYTLTLKPDLLWHDSSPQKLHQVTADDVLFTFKTIQDPAFPNPILHQNFRGVEIEKLDSRTVRFRLSKPYSFFPSNLTLGLLPAGGFGDLPVKKLDQALDFGFHPIGAGPYSFVGMLQTDLSTEVTLKRFPRSGLPESKLERIVFRIFPDYSTLLTDLSNLNGVRLVPRNDKGQPIVPRRFTAVSYTLPQYTALFFNLDRDIPSDATLRLGLQLATDKQEIIDVIHEKQIIDTPLLEIDPGDWRYKFDARAAQGALFTSNWNMPEKIRLQRLLERREANAIGPLRSLAPVVYLETGTTLTVTGSLQKFAWPLAINDRPVEALAATGSFLGRLVTVGTGALRVGMNVVKMTDAGGTVIDSAFVERIADARLLKRAIEEQHLVDLFLEAKRSQTESAITVDDLYLESGYLRRKHETDKPHTRINSVSGKPLKLTLLTSPQPEAYRSVADIVARQWAAIGVEVSVQVPTDKREFSKRMLERDYDVVLFGQSLLDNLDSYPYWHSSQIQEKHDMKQLKLDAFNLSQYASFAADTLLRRIREISDGKQRTKALADLNELLKRDTPAIFLYSPLSVFAYDRSIQGLSLGKLSLHSDRFLSLDRWYVTTQRKFTSGKSWLRFVPWMLRISR